MKKIHVTHGLKVTHPETSDGLSVVNSSK